MKAQDADDYIDAIAEPRRSEVRVLDAAIQDAVPELKRYLAYSGTMIGYGPYRYRYESGREGECPIVALSSRAQYISLYVTGNRNGQSIAEAAAPKLGKVTCGKACIRFRRLEDLNLPAALALVRDASGLLTNGSRDFSL